MSVLRTVVLSIAVVGQLQSPPQSDVKSRIAEASSLIGKRAFADAMKILDALAADPAVAADAGLRADVTYHTGNAWFLQNDYPKALDFLERSSELCRGRADRACESRALFRITQAHKNMGRYPVALQHGLALVAMAESPCSAASRT